MGLDKIETKKMIEIYKKIQEFIKFLEKEEKDNSKGE